jgi:hypothetical protein
MLECAAAIWGGEVPHRFLLATKLLQHWIRAVMAGGGDEWEKLRRWMLAGVLSRVAESIRDVAWNQVAVRPPTTAVAPNGTVSGNRRTTLAVRISALRDPLPPSIAVGARTTALA